MKRNNRIFIALFAFFIVVAIGALLMLDGKGSVFNRGRDSLGATPSVMSQTVIGDESVEKVEETTGLEMEVQEEVTAEEVAEETSEDAKEE